MIPPEDRTQKKQQKLLLFQRKLFDLDRGRYEVLSDEGFADELIRYLSRLIHVGHEEVAIRIFHKLGECTRNSNENLRDHMLSVATEFHQMNKENINQDLSILTLTLMLKWR